MKLVLNECGLQIIPPWCSMSLLGENLGSVHLKAFKYVILHETIWLIYSMFTFRKHSWQWMNNGIFCFCILTHHPCVVWTEARGGAPLNGGVHPWLKPNTDTRHAKDQSVSDYWHKNITLCTYKIFQYMQLRWKNIM